VTTVGWYDTGTSHDPGIQQEPAHQVPPCFEEAGAPRSVGDQLQRQQCFSAVLGHWSRSKLCHSLLEDLGVGQKTPASSPRLIYPQRPPPEVGKCPQGQMPMRKSPPLSGRQTACLAAGAQNFCNSSFFRALKISPESLPRHDLVRVLH
jgi:hypothetical protein